MCMKVACVQHPISCGVFRSVPTGSFCSLAQNDPWQQYWSAARWLGAAALQSNVITKTIDINMKALLTTQTKGKALPPTKVIIF